jgi:hypothetical protein
MIGNNAASRRQVQPARGTKAVPFADRLPRHVAVTRHMRERSRRDMHSNRMTGC